MKKWILWMIVVGMGLGNAHAEESLQLTTAAFQQVVSKDENGKVNITQVPAEKVVPGTEVLYIITYQNIGKKPVSDVVITNPIPSELTYTSAPETDVRAELTMSVDKGKTYDTLARLKVKSSDGKTRPAKTSDVTDLRWLLKSSVKPSEQGTVSFKAILK